PRTRCSLGRPGPQTGGGVREALLQNPIYRGTFIEKVMRHIEASAVQRANVVVFTSHGSLALFEGEHPGLLLSKDVRVVYTGIDTEELDSVPENNEVLPKYDVGQSTADVLCVGTLVKDKGVDTLIEAISLLPEDQRSRPSCLVVGRGPLKEELSSLIENKGLQDRVRLLGFLSRQEFLQLMRSATIFVLPSRVSVFDYILLEAGALGLPIITTAVGGNLEMFDQDSALLVPPDDPQALASAIARLLSDEALRQRLGQNAYHRIRSRFSLEAMFNAYAAIYQEIASRPEP
ncbi:MAG: glycosyltransferase family 4 protein, partial [Chloroflexota bacterium]